MESYIAMAAWKPLYKALEEENMRSLFFDIEMPLVFVLYEMQAEGIRVDSAALKEYGTMLGEKNCGTGAGDLCRCRRNV